MGDKRENIDIEISNELIDDYIDKLEKWLNKYPNAKVSPRFKILKKYEQEIRRYAKNVNIHYEDLLIEYTKMQEYSRKLTEWCDKGKLTKEQAKRVEKLELFEKRKTVDINERINVISKWIRDYPYIKVSVRQEISRENEEQLRLYAKNKKISYEELIKEYRKVQNYCRYFINKEREGRLTDQERELLIKANLEEVFIFFGVNKDLSEKYGLKPHKVKYIKKYFTSMEEFVKSYREGKLEKQDFKLFRENLIKRINIQEKPNEYIENLMEKFLELIEKRNSEIIVYDGNKVMQYMEELELEDIMIIEQLWGLENNTKKTVKEVAKQLGLSEITVAKRKNKVLDMLNEKFELYAITIKEDEIREFLDKFLKNEVILKPDKGYAKNIPQFKMEELRDYTQKILEKRKEQRQKIKEVSLEHLNLPISLIDILQKKSYTNTLRLIEGLRRGEISKIKNIGPVKIQMIKKSLQEYFGFTSTLKGGFIMRKNCYKIISLQDRVKIINDWKEKYPNIEITYSPVIKKEIKLELERYAKIKKISYEELEAQYKEIKLHYNYIVKNFKEGILTEEEKDMVRNAGLGEKIGLGYSDTINELVNKYGLRPEKVKYILETYGSVEEFIEEYKAGNLIEEDYKKMSANLITIINISETPNEYLDKVITEIFYKIPIEDLGIVVYDGDRLTAIMNSLSQKDRQAIEMLWGLKDGKSKNISETAKLLGKGRTAITYRRDKARDFLWKNFRLYGMEIEEGKFYETFLKNNVIIKPDEEYLSECPQIDFERLRSYCRKRLKGRENKKENREKNSLVNLGLTKETMQILQENGYDNIHKLIKAIKQGKVKKISKLRMKYVTKALEEYFNCSMEEILKPTFNENEHISKAKLQQLKGKKENLEEEKEQIQAKIKTAAQILDGYESLEEDKKSPTYQGEKI